MLTLQQIKLPIRHTPKELEKKILKELKLKKEDLISWTIRKQSLDSRKKPDLYFVYTIDVKVRQENQVLKRVNHKNVMVTNRKKFSYLRVKEEQADDTPVVVGSGPAGLFCAYYLAKAGCRPLLIERGDSVEQRVKTVQKFWDENILDPESNVQFGEGGAGTFSDGKLNTLVKDSAGRNHEVLKLFVECGAPEEILYMHKPHLGTDQLVGIVRNMRKKIEAAGGTIRFRTCLTDLHLSQGRLTAIEVNGEEIIPAKTLVLAIGHSARDTFGLLEKKGFDMHAKSFAVGFRMEHDQKIINKYQYGEEENSFLGAAAYKLTHRSENGRGVYSFCMCPGGYVVNASSEEGMLAVNGMSYQDRASSNANSAIVVTVSPEDFDSQGPLAGMEFQRKLEKAAYDLGKGKIPVQLFGDFSKNRESTALGQVSPCTKGDWTFANLRTLLPEELNASILDSILYFERIIPGFSGEDSLFLGVESRTSSPVRIERNKEFESNISGIYPCGEGAGYAGGITSAAMDGLKTGEAIVKKIINFS